LASIFGIAVSGSVIAKDVINENIKQKIKPVSDELGNSQFFNMLIGNQQNPAIKSNYLRVLPRTKPMAREMT